VWDNQKTASFQVCALNKGGGGHSEREIGFQKLVGDRARRNYSYLPFCWFRFEA
jgi:hypothetical protein